MPEPTHVEVIEALHRAPSLIVPLVREVPGHLLKRRPLPGKWSAHEHACHLAAVQPIFMERLALMLEQENPAIRGYQPEREHAPDALLAVDLDEAMDRFQRVAKLASAQPPLNLFERDAEREILPWCRKNGVGAITYGALCRGLLTGTLDENSQFFGDDLRQTDPKFQQQIGRAHV